MKTVNADQLSAANWERTGDGREGANLLAINWQSGGDIFLRISYKQGWGSYLI